MYKNMYDLKLNEESKIDDYTFVMRVPGGWIYTLMTDHNGSGSTSVFVPFDNEFQEKNS